MFVSNLSGGKRPSFFEMLAQDRMTSGIKAAAHYFLATLAPHHATAARLLEPFDEIFTGCMLLVESHSLWSCDSTFAEHFYDLKRTPCRTGNKADAAGVRSLSHLQRVGSLFFLVVVPYLKSKLDDLFSNTTQVPRRDDHDADFLPEPTVQNQTLRYFRLLYPFCNGLYEFSIFFFQLLYLVEASRFFTPFQWILRLVTRRVTPADLALRELQQAFEMPRRPGESVLSTLKRVLARVGRAALFYSKYFLIISAFLFKILEWWYSSTGDSQPNVLPVPPPPSAPPPAARNGVVLPADPTVCALCNNRRTNPTLVVVSGFVFCYSCIFSYVQTHERCPVTFLPTNLDQICKLYESK
eukprot:gnl/Spiro4/16718_TR8997_c0_g1_i1.p1 gnl/Spiro4/16718_TR8997_c0_g1~~gnl/Spiro4/16718_TR8997_c0_g1_i1.p1  ORF type:complete len:354 (+),score=53.60 gnl/Spiro4/16718_TR8997_c0_g1_i1:91-1152(+)